MNLEFKYDCEAQQWWSRRRAGEEMGEGEGACAALEEELPKKYLVTGM